MSKRTRTIHLRPLIHVKYVSDGERHRQNIPGELILAFGGGSAYSVLLDAVFVDEHFARSDSEDHAGRRPIEALEDRYARGQSHPLERIEDVPGGERDGDDVPGDGILSFRRDSSYRMLLDAVLLQEEHRRRHRQRDAAGRAKEGFLEGTT